MQALNTANPTNLKLLTTFKFTEDLKSELEKIPEAVTFLYFRILNQEMTQDVLPVLKSTLNSGTKVTIYADSIYSRQITSDRFTNPLFPKARRTEKSIKKDTLQLFDELSQLGCNIIYTGKPKLVNKYLLPFIKRDHRKVVIVEHKDKTQVAYFGASNLGAGKNNDYMVKVPNTVIAGLVTQSASYADKNLPKKDIEWKHSDEFQLIFDKGKHFQSLTMKRALELIDKAKSRIVFVSQLPPELPILRKLIKASKRGTNVEILLSHESHQHISSFPFNIAYKSTLLLTHTTSIKINHSSKGFIHAKVLIADDQVLVGSHNLSSIGVWSGTKELSAIVKDKKFLSEVEEFIETIR